MGDSRTHKLQIKLHEVRQDIIIPEFLTLYSWSSTVIQHKVYSCLNSFLTHDYVIDISCSQICNFVFHEI